jgi:acetyl esterase/lipase
MMHRSTTTLGLALLVSAVTAFAQAPPAPQGPGPAPGPGSNLAPGSPPTHADLDYAPAEPATSNGHKLDLYLSAGAKPWPVVIWTGGSAWMADTGKRGAGALALRLNPAGYAVAGVSIRSSSQVRFPGQLHDIKAAIRWLRANAARYNRR